MHPTQALLTQMGVDGPAQSELCRHWTQVLLAVSQTSDALVHAPALVPVHLTQDPVLLHAGAVAPLRALHSASPAVGGAPWVQLRHVNDVGSQMGVVAVAQFPDVRQVTHAPVAVRQ